MSSRGNGTQKEHSMIADGVGRLMGSISQMSLTLNDVKNFFRYKAFEREYFDSHS